MTAFIFYDFEFYHKSRYINHFFAAMIKNLLTKINSLPELIG